MIDNLKLISDNQNLIHRLRSFPDLQPYQNRNNVYEGFEICGKLLRIDFRKIYENGQLIGYRHFELSISPHYHYNGYLHNGNDFTPKNAQKTIREVLTYLGLTEKDFPDLQVVNLEYGLNLIPQTDIKKIISGISYHKKTPFRVSDFEFNKITDATKVKRIKAYAKGLQFADFPQYNIHKNTFRFEVKNKKSSALRKQGITTAMDFFRDEVYLRLSRTLIEEWMQVLIIDLEPNLTNYNREEKQFLRDHSNLRKWRSVIVDKNRNKFHRTKQKYFNLLQRNDSVFVEILNLFNDKIFSFFNGAFLPQKTRPEKSTSTLINKEKTNEKPPIKVVQVSPHARVLNGQSAPVSRKCIVTQLDI
jgi:hypothetical protein